MESKPFELLKKLHAAKHVAAIRTFLGSRTGLYETLSSDDRSIFGVIISDFEDWEAIEHLHGAGAVLNLSDPTILRLRGQLPYVRVIPASFYENAERYQGAVAA